MNHSIGIAASLLLILAPSSVLAWTAPASYITSDTLGKPNDLGPRDFVIDAVTGSTTGSLKHRQNAQIRIVVRDINPFLYTYRIESRMYRVAEASPAEFFKGMFELTIPAGPTPDTLAKISFLLDNPAGCDATVTGAALDAATAAVLTHSGKWTVLEDGAEEINRYLEAAALLSGPTLRGYRSHAQRVFHAGLRAPDIQKAALAAADSLGSLARQHAAMIGVLGSRTRAFAQVVKEFRTATATLPAKYPACETFARWSIQSERYAADTLRHKEGLVAMESQRQAAETNENILRPVATDVQRFYLSVNLPGVTAPHDVRIFLSRKAVSLFSDRPAFTRTVGTPPAPAYDTIGTYFLNVGGRGSISFGVGLAWSDVPTREYESITLVVPAGDGAPQSTRNIVGRKEESQGRLVPMLMLNTRLFDVLPESGFPIGVHLVLGAGSKLTGKAAADFLVGGGLSFLGNRIFLNTGLFLGMTSRLGDGFRVGQTIPTGTTIPIESRRSARPAISVSFRAVPW
jgi:hypothetical protein